MTPIPLDALAEHIAIVGRTGSGKTYAAKGVVEVLLAAGRRVCVIDPTGAWWGLRLGADGSADGGWPVVIVGGDHADVPLEPGAGGPLGRLVAESAAQVVLDLSDLTEGQRVRFMADFADEMYRRNRQPLHLVIDEADEFCPQSPPPDARPMSGRVDRIVRRGRVKGFRILMITQRPAVLHKNVLTQAGTLVAMRLPSPQDRKAVEGWIAGQADVDQGREMLATLAGLGTGDGWVWSPLHGGLQRVAFPPIRTWDSGRTPKDGEAAELPALPPVDAALFRDMMRPEEPEAAAPARHAPAVDIEAIRAAAHAAGRAQALQQVDGLLAKLRLAVEDAGRAVDALAGLAPAEPAPPFPAARAAPVPLRPPPAAAGTAKLGAERRILAVLAQRHPARFTEAQWATLAGMKRTGGTWGTYKSRLRTAGLLAEGDGLFGATEAGLAAVEALPVAPAGRAAIDQWREALGGGPARMIDVLAATAPDWLTRAQLAAATGIVPTGGTFGTYLSRLRANGLIEESGSLVRLAEILAREGRP